MAVRIDMGGAFQMMVDNGYIPLEPYQTSSTPWRCVHAVCEREVTPTVHQHQKWMGRLRVVRWDEG